MNTTTITRLRLLLAVLYAGTLAKQAILNLQRIVMVSGSSGSRTSPVTPNNKDLPASKRRRIGVSNAT